MFLNRSIFLIAILLIGCPDLLIAENCIYSCEVYWRCKDNYGVCVPPNGCEQTCQKRPKP
ncbi:unnamed protein product, partial [Onchocerca ochengi]